MVNTTLFADLVQAAGDVSVTNPRAVRNAAVSLRHIWALSSRGKPFQKSMDGGPNITGRIRLRNKGSAQLYSSGGTLTPTRVNTMSTFTMPWMKMAVDQTWDDEEVVLNGSSIYSESYVMAKYADMIDNLMNMAAEDLAEGVEGFLAAVPNALTMEGAGATAPMSLFTLVNDHFGSSGTLSINGNFYNPTAGAAFTTVMGIDNSLADKLRWRQKISAYNSKIANPTGGAGDNINIIGAMDEMFDQVNYQAPPAAAMNGVGGGAWEEPQWNNFVCICSMNGKGKFQQLARAQGDRWQDAGANEGAKGPGGALGVPMFAGMEIVHAPFMDAGTYYLDSYTSPTALVSELSGSGAGIGPRFVMLNLSDFQTTFHVDKYFQKSDTRHPFQQPFSNTIWYDTYFNFVNKFRWTSGIIAPGTTTGQWPSRTYTPASVYTA